MDQASATEIRGPSVPESNAPLLELEINWSQLTRLMKEKESNGSNEMTRYLLGWENPEGWFSEEQLAGVGF